MTDLTKSLQEATLRETQHPGICPAPTGCALLRLYNHVAANVDCYQGTTTATSHQGCSQADSAVPPGPLGEWNGNGCRMGRKERSEEGGKEEQGLNLSKNGEFRGSEIWTQHRKKLCLRVPSCSSLDLGRGCKVLFSHNRGTSELWSHVAGLEEQKFHHLPP